MKNFLGIESGKEKWFERVQYNRKQYVVEVQPFIGSPWIVVKIAGKDNVFYNKPEANGLVLSLSHCPWSSYRIVEKEFENEKR